MSKTRNVPVEWRRHPVDVLKNNARLFLSEHRETVPYVMFLPDFLLIEYQYKTDRGRYRVQIWENLRMIEGQYKDEWDRYSRPTDVRVEDPLGVGYNFNLEKQVKKAYENGISPHHFVKLGNVRWLSAGSRFINCRVGNLTKARSKLARSAFRILAEAKRQDLKDVVPALRGNFDEIFEIYRGVSLYDAYEVENR